MTNCIKQITSCTIKNKSQGCSCGIIEIIPPKHFIHVSSTDVHTCSAQITPQECSYKQQGTAGEVNTQRGSSISLCLILTVPHAFGLGIFAHEEGNRASCYSGHASLLAALLEVSLGSYAKYTRWTLLPRADNLPCLSWWKIAIIHSHWSQNHVPPKQTKSPFHVVFRALIQSLSLLSLKITSHPLLSVLRSCKGHSCLSK